MSDFGPVTAFFMFQIARIGIENISEI